MQEGAPGNAWGDVGLKACTVCKEVKPLDDFYKERRAPDGRFARCKPCHLRVSRDWQARNSERCSHNAKLWAKKNPERVLAAGRRHCQKPEYIAKKKVYRRTRLEHDRENLKKWRKDNPELRIAQVHKRRARLSNGHFTGEEIQVLYKKQHGKCAVCYVKLRGKYHIDHEMPLARGGSNTIDNIQLLCRSCNLTKNAKDPIVFRQQLGFLI